MAGTWGKRGKVINERYWIDILNTLRREILDKGKKK
jgi:hypothetical protein